MINTYYQQELAHLKELAVEFSKAHPALAPMLSGPTSDPDVERLLEGTAFLSGLIREKLDDQFPEILHSLLQLILPHYLQPLPSTTIMQFSPKPGLMEIMHVPAGAAVASIPVDGTSCTFTTCFDVEVNPLELQDTRMEKTPGGEMLLRLFFRVTGPTLHDWKPERLRLLIGGSYENAADRYHLIMHNARSLRIVPGAGGTPVSLRREHLRPVGFGEQEALLPYPSQSFPGYRLLQEYFILPHKFLFFDILGWDLWTDRGTGDAFEVQIQMAAPPHEPPQMKRQHFVLGATPAVNVFPHAAEPILLDHRRAEYRLRPADLGGENYQVFSVQRVIGFVKGTVRQREYLPFERLGAQQDDQAIYHVDRRISPVGEHIEHFLTVAYPRSTEAPQVETLSIDLLCTNAHLPESLQLGDISQPTETSPSLLDFKNIHPPTAAVRPPIGKELLWRLLSHLSLNYLPMSNPENLKALLKLYIFPGTRNRASVVANNKRVDGITDLSSSTLDRLVRGQVIRGRELTIKANGSNFASYGDLYLFGTVLDRFLASYSSINSFTSCSLEDQYTGEVYRWPMRVGDRLLL